MNTLAKVYILLKGIKPACRLLRLFFGVFFVLDGRELYAY